MREAAHYVRPEAFSQASLEILESRRKGVKTFSVDIHGVEILASHFLFPSSITLTLGTMEEHVSPRGPEMDTTFSFFFFF